VVNFFKIDLTRIYNIISIKKLFFISFAVAVLGAISFSILSFILKLDISNPIDSESLLYKITVGVVLAPLLETYLFQYLLNRILVKCRISNFNLLLLIQSCLFALSHLPYSIIYAVAMLWVGCSFNFFYLRVKELTTHYIKYTFLLHASYNLTAFILSYFL
jgi:membrane protease YdiL (CAAX protease family)